MAGKWLKRLGVGAASLLGLAISALVVVASLTKLPGENMTPLGKKQNPSEYIAMRDGTKIAADIWFPKTIQKGQRLPIVLSMTRYWRAEDIGWLQRAAFGLGLVTYDGRKEQTTTYLNDRGYILVFLDARGTGASGGNRRAEFDPQEIKDFGEVAAWAARQPWSNGSVGAMGVSYSANTAELLTTTGQNAVKAVVPLFDDFDPLLHNSMPGGAFNTGFITEWGLANRALDANDVCTLANVSKSLCFVARWWVRGVKPVDADQDRSQLAMHLAARQSNNVLHALKGVQFRDDPMPGSGGLTIADISPYGAQNRARIEASVIPMLIFASWHDAATGEGALSRFMTVSNPQTVYIGAFTHGGVLDTDQLAPVAAPASPTYPEQLKIIEAFLRPYLHGGPQPQQDKILHYFTMGARSWRKTTQWPLANTQISRLYLADNAALQAAAPTQAIAEDRYTVDPGAETGTMSRWHTQMTGGDVVYPDRAKQDKKLLVYTSSPLTDDMVVTGSPSIDMWLSSTRPDGLLIAYLEAVSPDGKVSYITEGVLRLMHHKVATGELPYKAPGIPRSFLRADASLLKPGQPTRIQLSLYATSIRIPKGYRVRIALAGAAAGLFDPVPGSETPSWMVQRSADKPSFIGLPVEIQRNAKN